MLDEEPRTRPDYLKWIRTCYQHHPDSVAYYDRFVDHIKLGSSRSVSSLQAVGFFEIVDEPAVGLYPRGFPFRHISHDRGKENGPKLAIQSGFPSPECVVFLGNLFSIRPEFFIGHLGHVKQAGTSTVYEADDLYSLPSARDNLVRLRFASVIESIVESPLQTTIRQRRAEVEDAHMDYEKSIISEGRFGASLLRKVNLHDGRFCSTEEVISMTVSRSGGQWSAFGPTAIFLTDHGRADTYQRGLPWASHANGRPVGTLPLIPYNMPTGYDKALSPCELDLDETPGALDQFHPLKRIAIRDNIDYKLMKEDPFFLLSAMITTSFHSWTQVLGVISKNIEECQRTLEFTQKELRHHLEQLRYNVAIIHRVNVVLSECHHLILQGGCVSWPKADAADSKERKFLIQEQLQSDHNNMTARCSLLLRESEFASTVLVSYAQLTASEKATSQATEVNNLTKVAVLFIPLTFATAIFGMNVAEWDPPPSWWWPLGTALVVSFLTYLWLKREDLWPRSTRLISRGIFGVFRFLQHE